MIKELFIIMINGAEYITDLPQSVKEASWNEVTYKSEIYSISVIHTVMSLLYKW